jgi:chromosome segregation ATPase
VILLSLLALMLNVVLCLQEEKQTLVASRDNLDRLYRAASNSLTILERSHCFTMSDLDHHRHKLHASKDEVSRLGQLLSTKDSIIRELRASKKLVAQELEAAQLAIKTLENNYVVLKAQRDRAMDKAVRARRILMRRPGVVVPDDIVSYVKATPDAASHPSSSVAPTKDVVCKYTST